MNRTAGELADVLLVEDDPGDALLIQESFGPAGSSNRRCHVASHSDQALREVRRTGEFADAPRPKLILLDLNLGQTHGLEVLAQLKSDNDLLAIPSSYRRPHVIHRHRPQLRLARQRLHRQIRQSRRLRQRDQDDS
jgi:CheY-like chemotaxis protein